MTVEENDGKSYKPLPVAAERLILLGVPLFLVIVFWLLSTFGNKEIKDIVHFLMSR